VAQPEVEACILVLTIDLEQQYFLEWQIPNGLGALLSTAQLILYFMHYHATPKDEPKQDLEVPEVVPTSAPDSFSCVTVEK
jgi:hypothetical protein